MKFLITGATGNTGWRIAKGLIELGHEVRAVSRGGDRLRELANQGARTVAADLLDTGVIADSLTGVDAAYLIIPPHPQAENLRRHQNQVAASLVQAVRRSGVKYIVALSSVGAHRSDRVGPVGGLHDFENHLAAIDGINVLALRPAYFMENLLWSASAIKVTGAISGPANDTLLMPFIASQDIAEFALKALTTLNFEGMITHELLGQRDLTWQEVAAALGGAIGMPDLRYRPITYEEAEAGLMALGLSQDVAANYVELQRAINVGWLQPAEKRSPGNTTPTSIERFAETVFAPYYKSVT